MKSNFKKLKLYFKQYPWYIGLFVFLFLGSIVYAGTNTLLDGWRINSGVSNLQVDYNTIENISSPISACAKISNSSGNNYFVPTRTFTEWNNFSTKAAGVTTVACCTNDCSPNGAVTCSGGYDYVTCGNYDADSCWEWSGVSTCGTNYCSTPHTTGSCSNTCPIDTCSPCTPTCTTCTSGWYNCDGSWANGCESNTSCYVLNSYSACYLEDRYWYDSNNTRQTRREDCSGVGAWFYYCLSDSIYRYFINPCYNDSCTNHNGFSSFVRDCPNTTFCNGGGGVASCKCVSGRYDCNGDGTGSDADACESSTECCVPSWSPLASTVCSGTNFTQTSNCGTTRSAVGTKTDGVCCVPSWSPLASTVCSGTNFTQTSNCGTTQSAVGTKSCSSHAVDGPVCVSKTLRRCDAWCTALGAWCNAATWQSYCAGSWYNDAGYQTPVQCCVDSDCSGSCRVCNTSTHTCQNACAETCGSQCYKPWGVCVSAYDMCAAGCVPMPNPAQCYSDCISAAGC